MWLAVAAACPAHPKITHRVSIALPALCPPPCSVCRIVQEKNDPFVELVFRDDVGIQTKAFYHKHLRYLPACSAQTGEGVARALAALRLELDRMDGRIGGDKAAGGAGATKGAHLLGRRHVPADLFALTGAVPAGAVANLRATGGAATATAGQTGGGGGGTTGGGTTGGGAFGGFFGGGGGGSERKAQPPGKKSSRDDEDDDDGAPITDKGQRAQCSSMAAAACNIQ